MSTTARDFHYKTLDFVAGCLSHGDYLSVVDIAAAYRTVHIYPDHRQYQGFEWRGDYYLDNRLSFGLKCAPFIFTNISDFVVRTMYRYGYKVCVNYVDDFLCHGPTLQDCVDCQVFLIKLLNYLGFEVAAHKVIPPSQKVIFLGILIDTLTMEYSLPQHKLDNLLPMLRSFLSRDKATKLQLQQLAGYLAHCSYVVRGGRVFVRRLIDLINSLPSSGSVGKISSLVRDDIEWWLSFAKMFNGKAGIIGATIDDQVYLCTDASLTGFGATCHDDFLVGVWGLPHPSLGIFVSTDHWWGPPRYAHVDKDINVLEMWPVVCAVIRWGASWRHKKVILYTDNMQVMYAVNTNKSKNKVLMQWLREIFWASVIHNFHLVAKRISSKNNILPDCLSRISVPSARELCINLLIQGRYNFSVGNTTSTRS